MLESVPIEALSKAVSIPLAIIGTFIVVMRYLDVKRSEQKTARLEARKPFNQKQQEAYLSLVETTSLISIRYGKDDWEIAFDRFWVMYWGIVPIVADEDVSIAIDKFADTLEAPHDGVPMRNASMDLARACRRSLGESWRVDFEPYAKSERAAGKSVTAQSDTK